MRGFRQAGNSKPIQPSDSSAKPLVPHRIPHLSGNPHSRLSARPLVASAIGHATGPWNSNQQGAFATVFFLYNLLFAALLEEPGWRGFLLPRMQQQSSPLVATLLVWLPWALWHAHPDYYRPGGFSLVFYLETRVIFLIPIALIMTWLYNAGGESLQASAIFHASMNTFPFVLPYFMPAFALLFVIAGYAVFSKRLGMPAPRRSANDHATANTTISRVSN